jgi:membrane-associated phospholipid phosphatase
MGVEHRLDGTRSVARHSLHDHPGHEVDLRKAASGSSLALSARPEPHLTGPCQPSGCKCRWPELGHGHFRHLHQPRPQQRRRTYGWLQIFPQRTFELYVSFGPHILLTVSLIVLAVSWAGLLYLTLFLASKFSVAIPFLPPRPFSTNPNHTSAVAPSNLKKQASMAFSKQESSLSSPSYAEEYVIPIRYQNAAPPVWTLLLILVPIGSAIYVCASRFTDFRHFGFDILFGSLIGITTAWFSFRFYHLPITRGAGWAWGPRSYDRAWGIGVGRGSYVGTEGWSKSGRSETAGVNSRMNGDRGVLRESDDVTATHAV